MGKNYSITIIFAYHVTRSDSGRKFVIIWQQHGKEILTTYSQGQKRGKQTEDALKVVSSRRSLPGLSKEGIHKQFRAI